MRRALLLDIGHVFRENPRMSEADATNGQSPVGEDHRTPGRPSNSRRRTVWMRTLGVFVLLGGILVIAFSSRALNFALREILARLAPTAGFEVVSVQVDAGWGRAILLRDLEIKSARESNETRLRIHEVAIAPPALVSLFSGDWRPLERVSLLEVAGILDLRTGEETSAAPVAEFSEEQAERALAQTLRWLPRNIFFTSDSLKLLLDGAEIEISGATALLRDESRGHLGWQAATLRTPTYSLSFPPSRAIAIRKGGSLVLSDWPVLPGLPIQSLTIEPFRPGVVSLQLEGGLFGGRVRGTVRLYSSANRPPLECTLLAGGIRIPAAVQFFDPSTAAEAEGEIRSLNLNFRGDPGNLPASEALVRVEADAVRWQGRGWERLVAGIKLGDGRVVLSEFVLQQQENQILAQGELLWPGNNDFSDPRSLEAKGSLSAEITDLSALAALAGEPFSGLSGTLSLESEWVWRRGEASGTASLSGGDWTWRGISIGGANLRAALQSGELRISEFAWKNGADSLDFEGRVRISDPHLYSGKANLSVAQIANYAALLPGATRLPIRGGIELQWQGDGTRSTHSGVWEMALKNLTTPELPEGVSGTFRGSYSPESLFSECRLTRGKLDLSFNLSAGTGGTQADKIYLRSGRTALLDGTIYLPWNPLPVLAGNSWQEGLLEGKNVYADVRTRKLQIRELAALFGQAVPVDAGFFGVLSASGPVSAPEINGYLEFDAVRVVADNTRIFDTGKIVLQAKDGRAVVQGELRPVNLGDSSIDPVLLELAFPFGFAVAGGRIEWNDPLGSLQGKVRLPGLQLSQFATLLPQASRLQGALGGEITIGRSLANPSLDGLITLRNGRLAFGRQQPEFTNLRMTARFDGSSLRFEDTGGELGAGPFELSGEVRWADPANPRFDLRLRGEQLLLYRDRTMRLRADFALSAQGDLRGGQLSGTIALVDGRFFQRLEITPLLQKSGPDSGSPLLLPDLAGMIPPPLGNWRTDVTIVNKTPFLFVGNLASGSIDPELRIVGTLGDPRPTGKVTLRDLRAFLPFATVTIPEGIVMFQEETPRSPVLDIRGHSQVLEYDIELLMQGPLEQKNLILRSDPPLSQEQILLLLTAGIAPGTNTGAGVGDAVIGQGSLLVLKTLLRNFEPGGVDVDSLLNRVQVVTAPPSLPGQRPALRGEFRLVDNLAIYSERDGLGFLGAGLTYRIRFR